MIGELYHTVKKEESISNSQYYFASGIRAPHREKLLRSEFRSQQDLLNKI